MATIKARQLTLTQRVRLLFGGDISIERTAVHPAPVLRRPRRGRIRQTQRAVEAGRQIDTSSKQSPLLQALGLSGATRAKADMTWRTMNLDSQTFDRLSLDELLEMLVDISPQLSKILWDLLRFCNPGYEVSGSDLDGEPSATVQAWVDNLLNTLDKTHGIAGILFNRLAVSLALRGAVFGEIVLDDGKTLDITADDPLLATFRKLPDGKRGQVWHLGQTVDGEFVDLHDVAGVVYIPLDPLPNDPYGRPMQEPTVFSVLFILGLLHDLRRVIMQQGYTRYHAQVKVEQLLTLFDELRGDADDGTTDGDGFETFVEDTIDTLQQILKELEPDESLVTTDAVTLTAPGGALSDSSINAAGEMARLIERMITQGGKTVPLLMGSNEAVSETHANRQWEIYVENIRTVQHIIENYFERMAAIGLQAAGIQGHVKLRFAELRKSEAERDLKVELLKAELAKTRYLMGWINHEEASLMATGHKPDLPQPRVIDLSTGQDLVADDFDGFSYPSGNGERAMAPRGNGRLIVDQLPPVPPELVISDGDTNRALQLWNRLMPDYSGLLNASIDGVAETASNWRFDTERYEYTNSSSGETLGQHRLRELRDEFSAAVKADNQRTRVAFLSTSRAHIPGMVDDLLSNDITLSEWVLEMREAIKSAYIAQYVAARGGRFNMTSADWGRIGRMMAPNGQYHYLNLFAQDIAAGGLSRAQIIARANMYLSSATQAAERGKAAAYGVSLPTYPGDGTQACLSNCQCWWEYVYVDGQLQCYWRLRSAEHCETCLSNAAEYAPYIPQEV